MKNKLHSRWTPKTKIHIAVIKATHIHMVLNTRKWIQNHNVCSNNNANMELNTTWHTSGSSNSNTWRTKSEIQHVERIDRRIVKIVLKSQKYTIPITILSIYAPRKGYKQETRTQRWIQVDQILNAVPKTHLCIWRTDANGQLGNRNRDAPEHAKIIGMNTTANKTGRWNGKSIQKLCIAHDAIPMNTWKRRHGQQQHYPLEAATWISPDGETYRRIDYILINQKYRNFIRETHALHNWRSDTEQRQHAAIKMEICLHLKHSFPREDHRENGT